MKSEPIVIEVEVKPASDKTIRNYYEVKELPADPICDWSAEDEAGWDW